MSASPCLFSRVDAASLGVFRISFGVILLVELVRYLLPDASGVNWVEGCWLKPKLLFPYDGFGWLHPLPGIGMYLVVSALMLCATCIALGAWYRIAMPCFALGFAYLFLLDRTHYLNHFYLITLLGFLLCVIPAHAAYSIDAARHPRLRARGAPVWSVWLVRLQLGLVYFWGGIAKLDAEWLSGVPARLGLQPSLDTPMLGALASQAWFQLFIAYGGLGFDLLVFPLLVWRRTRALAFVAAVTFHLSNAVLFSIGIFPWLMIAATTIYFAPMWPRRWWGSTPPTLRASIDAVPLEPPPPVRRAITLALLAAYVAVQLWLQLRSQFNASDTAWTEQDHRFSWRMMLRAKIADPRFVQVMLTDPRDRRSWMEDPAQHLSSEEIARLRDDPRVQERLQKSVHAKHAERGHLQLQMQVLTWPLQITAVNSRGQRMGIPPQRYLTVWQARKIAITPEYLVQCARALRRELASQAGWDDAAVFIDSWVSLNGRPPQRLVPPDVDLCTIDPGAPISSWVLPLTEPLPSLRGQLYPP